MNDDLFKIYIRGLAQSVGTVLAHGQEGRVQIPSLHGRAESSVPLHDPGAAEGRFPQAYWAASTAESEL